MAHPELPPDHLGHPPRRPHRAHKPVRFRPLGQHSWQLCPLLGGELRRLRAAAAAAQRLPTAFPCRLQPLADRALAHPQRLRDARPRPPLFMQFQGAQASPFLPIGGWAFPWCRRAHAIGVLHSLPEL